MENVKRKRRVKKTKILGVIVFLLFLILIGILIKGVFLKKETSKVAYISSLDTSVKLYNGEFEEIGTINRGSEVKVYSKDQINGEEKYKKILYDNKMYLISIDSVSDTLEQSIKETTMFVRTPLTVYQKVDSYEILGFLPKASEVSILGFDKLNNGVVNKYKISYNDSEGYVYAKYLVNTKEEADINYNENGIYDIHKDRKYSMELYGGKASNLDYYPNTKISFEDNVMPEEVRTFYLNGTPRVLGNIDAYIKLAKDSNINAFVVDIKDGYLSYKSEVAKNYSMTAYNSGNRSMDEYKVIIDKLKENGFYVIGRIVAFNDSHFAKDNPDESITKDGTSTGWTSAFSRKAWEYNIALAKEAINYFDFNEIQFDYVRFPDSSYSMSKNNYDFKNKYGEEKGQTIQNFLLYAKDQIHELNTYLAVDVFGECANTYMTAYGQYWPAISNVVDVISAMPYPDHFNKYDYGFKVPVWTVPYELLMKWGSSAASRQKEIPTPAKARTWIQAYNAIHEPRITYDASMVAKQIQALYDSGLKDGYITWNSVSSLEKYTEISAAFKKDYR